MFPGGARFLYMSDSHRHRRSGAWCGRRGAVSRERRFHSKQQRDQVRPSAATANCRWVSQRARVAVAHSRPSGRPPRERARCSVGRAAEGRGARRRPSARRRESSNVISEIGIQGLVRLGLVRRVGGEGSLTHTSSPWGTRLPRAPAKSPTVIIWGAATGPRPRSLSWQWASKRLPREPSRNARMTFER